jgi:hypothetical protein
MQKHYKEVRMAEEVRTVLGTEIRKMQNELGKVRSKAKEVMNAIDGMEAVLEVMFEREENQQEETNGEEEKAR